MGGPSKELTVPRRRPRRCVGCGGEFARGGLIRVVRSPEGAVMINAGAKTPGRGAYVCMNRGCVAMARKKNALARALKTAVGPEIYDGLEELCVEGTG